MMNFIIGVDDFGKTVTEELGFIDKTLFIKEIFDNKSVEVSVIVRPRRFGKTLNLSMLHHFLASEVNGLKTQGMFDNLKIAQQGDGYMQHQGKYPVIFITFKSIRGKSFDEAYKGLSRLISEVYGQHRVLLSGTTLYDDEKEVFEDILRQRASQENIMASLSNLSKYLHRHYKVKPWLLIDEYDTPIQESYLYNYYDDMMGVMHGLLSNALKGNANMHRSVVTGILRIAKENLFSGLNNVQVYSVLDKRYADHFGFTEAEVDAVLKKNNLAHLSPEIKAWYNGYQIGDSRIYNPWSIASCINEMGVLKLYWINSSENGLIKKLLAQSSPDFKERFESILRNESIEAFINESLIFPDLNENEEAIWSLLLFSGYLTATQMEQCDAELQCTLRSPNQEISALYRSTVRRWFTQKKGKLLYQQLLNYLVQGQLDLFLPLFQKFLLESISYFDVSGQESERFYHGFVMGMIVSLPETHLVRSNKESGLGRYDVSLIPKDKTKLGIILEFKVAKLGENLQDSAEEALAQINARGYAAELIQEGVPNILKIGLAFRGKEVAMASEPLKHSAPK